MALNAPMNALSPHWFRLAVVAAVAGVALPAAAQESLPPELGTIMGLGSNRLLDIQEMAAQAEAGGEYKRGMSALAAVARASREAGDRVAWLEAELAWVRLAAKDGEEPDLEEALEVLAGRARDWGLVAQEVAVFTYWAQRLEGEGKWREAVRALEGAAQAALSNSLAGDAVKALLAASQICRSNDHPWKLQQLWGRIAQVEAGMAARLSDDVRKQIAAEREAAAPLLDSLPPLPGSTAGVDLQPSLAAVKVSKAHREVARTRFSLTNESLQTVAGAIEVAPAAGVVKSWETGHSGHWLTVGEPAATEAPRPLRSLKLRPWERISLYVENEQPALTPEVSLRWTDAAGGASGSAAFEAASTVTPSAIVNAGAFQWRPLAGVPFYHEINHRGGGVKTEDLLFQANLPCRLEIFDADTGSHPLVDAGELLAVDAEGDGDFSGPADRVISDHNRDGQPDVLIGDRSRSLEIFAWPLVPLLPGEELIISASLRRPDEPHAWRRDAENSVRP